MTSEYSVLVRLVHALDGHFTATQRAADVVYLSLSDWAALSVAAGCPDEPIMRVFDCEIRLSEGEHQAIACGKKARIDGVQASGAE